MPVRRIDPAKRDRTQPTPKPVVKVGEDQLASQDRIDSNFKPQDKAKMDSHERGSEGQAHKPEGTRQRNHRFDGRAHGEPFAEPVFGDKLSKNRPLRSDLRIDSVSESKQEEFKQPYSNQITPKQHKPAGVDTRITPRPDKNEPQYRQAPRRGGKVRDG